MLNYTCVTCKKELRCEKNDVPLVHFVDNEKEKGIDAVRYGDIYYCPVCGCRVILGLSSQRIGINVFWEEREDILKDYVEVKR